MKIDNGNEQQEKRKKHYITPIIYFLAELTIAWLILSIISVDFNINNWHMLTKAILILVAIYSGYKTYKVYKRQKDYKR
ncbi:MAG: hypothetical protein K0U38_02810 [Epsilonproteobacteria bacterium]|nr:hypothetical protein [Campylobacterota bacterium]